MPQPHLAASKCLEFEAGHYDGGSSPDPVVDSLRPWVECIPACPETELGPGPLPHVAGNTAPSLVASTNIGDRVPALAGLRVTCRRRR